MLLSTALSLAMSLQSAGDSVQAIYPEDPTTWSLEYPTRIGPYVQDYYNCLRSGSYEIGGGTSFGDQYRADVPRCAKTGSMLEAEANAALAENGTNEATPPEEVANIFERARRIHVARGQSLDLAVRTRLATKPEYDVVRGRVPVSVDGDPPRCIARLANLIDQRAAYMEAEDLRIDAVRAKAAYTEDDRRELNTYKAQLQQYNSLIMIEKERCPAAGTQEIANFDNDPSNAQD